MTFLTRYDDDTRAPRVRDAARDALVRAVLPAIGLWLVVVGFGWMLVDGPLQGLAEAEEKVNDRVASGRTPTWNTITEYFSLIGSTGVIIAVAVVVAVAVWWGTKRWWMAVIPLLAILLQSIVFGTASYVVGRDRPTVKMLDDSPPTTSYPSGHESASTALYVSFLLLSLRVRSPALRWTLVGLCSVMPLLVFYARLYRGMHHITDLLAGIVNGVVCALLAWNYLRRDPKGAREVESGQADESRVGV
jgi:membrane-associated phospholipid phosphatase